MIVLFGLISYQSLPREAAPDITKTNLHLETVQEVYSAASMVYLKEGDIVNVTASRGTALPLPLKGGEGE